MILLARKQMKVEGASWGDWYVATVSGLGPVHEYPPIPVKLFEDDPYGWLEALTAVHLDLYEGLYGEGTDSPRGLLASDGRRR